MRSPASRGRAMRSAVRFGVIGAFVVGASFVAPHAVLAQTDEAHQLCAQGGGDFDNAGAGGAVVPSNPDNSGNETAAFGNGQGGGDGGQGGGGAGGGLGGADGGGGAGGCGPD